ncbi:MAG: 2-amino-4-hydroxy-6-hydroxymethyldihydropteridine diphosphokinase [Acidobacteriia bacterium]|nr:2-amino-4-hydroxy-6-hydroxymethyldihydropteridine diphosphokinase [Terriglobia bacterium]
MKLAYLGLGSNLGDREEALREALRKLEAPDLRLITVSSLYETEPVGYARQGWFLNLCAEVETTLFPKQLLQRTQRVEREMGRRRTITNGPRVIDVDILLYGNAIIETKELQVPHPRYRERRFVLAPLAELKPSLRDPETGRSMTEMLANLQDQTVRIVGKLS